MNILESECCACLLTMNFPKYLLHSINGYFEKFWGRLSLLMTPKYKSKINMNTQNNKKFFIHSSSDAAKERCG
jgi:hypothetical protein